MPGRRARASTPPTGDVPPRGGTPPTTMAAFMPPPARRVVPGLDGGAGRRDACPPAPTPPTVVPLPAPGAYALMQHGPRGDGVPAAAAAGPWRHAVGHLHPHHHAAGPGGGGAGSLGTAGTSPHAAHFHPMHALPQSTGAAHPTLGGHLWAARQGTRDRKSVV